jgi:NAD(P)-dependent dehydrogenase (short-subunit alcohol dehydrogenase family)
MKILIIGGTGTIGKKVAEHFSARDKVLIAGRSNAGLKADLTDTNSIRELFKKTGRLDAIVCIAGETKWGPFETLEEADFYDSLKSKLMGQVNLVRIGVDYLNPCGSVTLSTGILADDPVVHTTAAAMVNGGIHSFVKAVALELKNGIRINAVSLGVVEDAYEKYKSFFPGHNPIPTKKVINAYVRSIDGKHNGEIIRVYDA